MIIDSLENAKNYYGVHSLFASAFDYIRKTDLISIETGKFDIDGDQLKGILSDKNGVSKEESLSKFECHDRNIDIQFCIRGKETIGWKPRQKCVSPKGDYNAEKDVRFFNDAPDTFFQLTDGQFAIFFPDDVHAPMIGDQEIRKLVIKVKIQK